MNLRISSLVAVLLSVLLQSPAWSQRNPPPSKRIYLGRRIAQTMHYTGAEWLIRDTREREERASLMLEKLGVKPGMNIGDIGCGNGYHSIRMAKMTGDKGRVYAVDIQPEMLILLRKRMEQQAAENVIPILGSLYDPRLPNGTLDLILLVDVYHEFSHPERMLRAMRDSLAPGGRIALLEYRAEDPEVPIKPLHKMTKKQIMREFPANGLKLVSEFEGLPWQHMMFFGKDPDWKPKGRTSEKDDEPSPDGDQPSR